MKAISNSSRRVSEHILRALNKDSGNQALLAKSPNCSIVTWDLEDHPFQDKRHRGVAAKLPMTQR